MLALFDASRLLPFRERADILRESFIILALLCALLALGFFGYGMSVPLAQVESLPLSLELRYLPYYAGRSVLRMLIAFAASIVFTVACATLAARNRLARSLILPALDILQSVPVLGFLSITVTGFLALFPGSLLGAECAAVFAIFTSQVWNLTFSFYHSLVAIPEELVDAAKVSRLGTLSRFLKLDLPYGAIGLVWNGMMSFGGGWFFVTQSEAITVMNKNIKLPGIGSYLAQASEEQNHFAVAASLLTLLLVICVFDQLVWRPLLVWVEKFKFETTQNPYPPQSAVLRFVEGSKVLAVFERLVFSPLEELLLRLSQISRERREKLHYRVPALRGTARGLATLAFVCVCLSVPYYASEMLQVIRTRLGAGDAVHILRLTLVTLGRVFLATALSSLIWIPLGVRIGLRPRLAARIQPLCQMAASFPVNMLFPFCVMVFVNYNVDFNFLGSCFLMSLGTQWYIAYNVIAGASALPEDLREVAASFQLGTWAKWKKLLLPAIFPFWVTGACTAAGGAWNASIVAEIIHWGSTTLLADGIGSYISVATQDGDMPKILASIGIMSLVVVTINRCLWRPLYERAAERYRLG